MRIQIVRKIWHNQSFFFKRDSKIIPDHCNKVFPSIRELKISEQFKGARATDFVQIFNIIRSRSVCKNLIRGFLLRYFDQTRFIYLYLIF